MARKPFAADVSARPDVTHLAEVVTVLAQQVRQLALLLDEVREELIHAVRVDRFNAAGASAAFVAAHLAEPVDKKSSERMPVEPPPVLPTGAPPAGRRSRRGGRPPESLFS